MRTIVVLFNRDLRIHDHPALTAAAHDADLVIPLFVVDPAIGGGLHASPNRAGFLAESLADLRRSLDGRLVIRYGDTVEEVRRLAPDAVYASADVSAAARRRERLLGARTFPGVGVIDLEDVKPYTVFTPYYRAWLAAPRREILTPPSLTVPDLDPGPLPRVPSSRSPDVLPGGETAGLARLADWASHGVARYGELADDLAADATSRLSPYLHFGCVSPLAVARRVERVPGSEPFLRQLAWRDFYAQLLLHRPDAQTADLRPRGDRWLDDPGSLAAWKAGLTGYPVVDAGMRQLAREGFMHNRARLLTGSFLAKHLYLDWREGASHFFELLLDGDVASNIGNWQWVAGTGADTRPNRVFNPILQGRRHDPEGAYVRRYVPELAAIEGLEVHEPWKLDRRRRPRDYPAPIVEHSAAVARFRALRSTTRSGTGREAQGNDR